MKKALITGITGQDGAYLAELLLQKGYEVYGMMRRVSTPNFWRLDELGITDKVKYVHGDLTDANSLDVIIKEVEPDEVYNLAAQSFVGESWNQPTLTMDVNAIGVINLLSAIKNNKPDCRFYQASTSEMFGNSNQDGIQTESTALHPCSPYAISKLAAHWTTINFRESFGLFTCSGILFNHESPLRGIEFVTRKITDGVARIHLGLQDKIYLGNLDSRRDWGHAKDYVRAMWAMMQQEHPDSYIISTENSYSIREFLTEAFACIGISDWTDYVGQDPRFMRPAEPDIALGLSRHAREKISWNNEITFGEMVKEMVRRDIERLKEG